MARILITGAGGFIGKHLSDALIKNGDEVYCVGLSVNNLSGRFVFMFDLRNVAEARRMIDTIKPDIIYHCAGSADVNKSVANPEEDFEGNVQITHNLLFSVKELKMECKVIFLSSAAVYGNTLKLPIAEDAERNPLSPYALHKAICEDICFYMIQNYNMDIRIARVFSAYGEGLKKQLLWDMYNKVVDFGELELFGTGEETRDYIYIDDLCQALILIANSDLDAGHIFNVANGEEISIKYVAELFSESV